MSQRPKHLNLLSIRLPLPGVLSIFHRISGLILLLALPLSLAALQCSLSSAEGYAYMGELLARPFMRLCALAAMWALFHHICAGVRFLLLDFHVGVSLPAARFSAGLAFVVSLVATAIFAVWLWS